MALSNEEIARIGDYLKDYLPQWVREFNSPALTTNAMLLERLIRLEEELKAQRELMEARFAAMDKRFESVDKRFESMDKRFESMDKRFEDLIHYMDKRFEDLIHYMDKRFDSMNNRFSSLQWMIGLGFTLIAALMAVFNFL